MTLIKKEYNGTWVRGKPKFTTKSSPINVDASKEVEIIPPVTKRSKLTKENQQKLKKLVGGGFQTIA